MRQSLAIPPREHNLLYKRLPAATLARMSERPLRWGYLGTGRLLAKFVDVFRLLDDNALVAVASHDGERARAAAARFGIPRAHAGYEALLADPEVDIVLNALHNGLHCEWTVRALAAGKHVLCEKPLACSSAEVERMFAASHQHRRWLMEGLMYRFHPQMAEAKRLVDDGAIGQLLYLHSARIAHGREPGNPRYDRNAGGGALMDIGCYNIHLSRFFAGSEPERVAAHARFDETGGVDLTLSATLEFAGGATAQFVCSFEGEPTYAAEIVGTAGRLVISNPWNPPMWPTDLVLIRNGKSETIWINPPDAPQNPLAGFALELKHFGDCVREGRAPSILSEADSRGNMRVIEAVAAAARGGTPVDLRC